MNYDNLPFEIVKIAAAHEILHPIVAATLADRGFEEVGPLKWLRSADAPIRPMLVFQQWKGGQLAPSWGFSLDFVPHIAAGRVKWHRSPKSAMLDLCIDSASRSLDIPYTYGLEPIRKRSVEVVKEVVANAELCWRTCRTTSGLIEAFMWAKQYYAARGGLGFYNMTQHSLALAFCYARNGDLAMALRELDDHGPALDDDEREKLLLRLRAEAKTS